MSSRRRRKPPRTRRLEGTESQRHQAAEISAKFWHGGFGAPDPAPAAGDAAPGQCSEPSADGVVSSPVAELVTATPPITITPDPTSTVRSLGKPPLVGREAVAEHYFEAVYQRAVAMAGALAAAADLLDDAEEASGAPKRSSSG